MVHSDSLFKTNMESTKEVGFIEQVLYPLVMISGLPKVSPSELVIFENGDFAEVISMTSELVTALVFSNKDLNLGTRVARTGKSLSVPVGMNFLGHSINALGQSLYPEKPAPAAEDYKPLNILAPGIASRKKITHAFETGVTVVDLLVPLGMGQRELIVGDRKTGKTIFLLQAILTQAKKGTICIYAGIGKKRIDIRKVESFIQKNNINDKCIIMASSSSDPLGLIHITPYAAMSMAEYYRDLGYNVLLILDDLSTHAKFYREIALLGGSFPGRGSYPGDIFYAHAKLLERAGNFIHKDKGEVSITCLPVAETVEGDISGYISTNLMSITDGHIFFDRELFAEGRRPAVNYFLSVTRVGRQTQTGVRWDVNRELNSFLSLLEKTKDFVHFGAELNEGITSTIAMGEKVISFFNQHMEKIVPLNIQILIYCLVWIGIWQHKDKGHMKSDIDTIINAYTSNNNFRGRIDDIITNSDKFNTLLGKLTTESQGIIDQAYILVKGENGK